MPKNERGNNIKNIRTYVLGLIYRTGFSSVQVPSSIELAKEFSVTRRTARMALEGLIAEGFLISKKGIGTFTNPKHGFRLGGTTQKPFVGLSIGDGSFFYYDYGVGTFFSDMMKQLLLGGANVYPFVHLPVSEEVFRSTVKLAGINALLICFSCRNEKFDKMLSSLTIPVVTVKNDLPGRDSVKADYTSAFHDLLSIAAKEGRRRIVKIRSIKKDPVAELMLKEKDPRFDFSICDVTEYGYETGLRKILSSDAMPDLLISGWRSPQLLMRLVCEFGISESRCRIVLDSEPMEQDLPFDRMVVSSSEFSRTASELVMQRLANPALPVQRRLVSARYIKTENISFYRDLEKKTNTTKKGTHHEKKK